MAAATQLQRDEGQLIQICWTHAFLCESGGQAATRLADSVHPAAADRIPTAVRG